MARVTKDPVERRDELLDIALRLCGEIGYEAMSVEQVTRAAGVAKGTFYHYFRSKDELLVNLIQRFVDELFAYLQGYVDALQGTGAERLRATMLAAASWKTSKVDQSLSYLPFLFKPENFALRHRLYDAWIDRTRPVIQPLIAAGCSDGSFHVDDPEATGEVILSLWGDAGNRLWDRAQNAANDAEFSDIMGRGTAAIWSAQERVLGAEPGSLGVTVDPAVFESVRDAFTTTATAGGAGTHEPTKE